MIKNLKKRIEKFKNSAKKLPRRIKSVGAILNHRNRCASSTSFAFFIDGGLGDYILSARFIRDFMSEMKGARFDIFCENPKIAKWIFKNIDGFESIIDKKIYSRHLGNFYAMVLKVFCYPDVVCVNVDDKKIRSISSSIEFSIKNIRHIIQAHPHLDGYLGDYCAMKGWRRYNYIHHCSGVEYGGHLLALDVDLESLGRFDLNGAPYITISNGYDLGSICFEHRDRKFSTKVYPHFEDIVKNIRIFYPNIQIIQIGDKSGKPILSADKNLIGQTTLPEVAAILNGSLLHIDNEGGLVHLAKAMGTDSCVIFGPTSVDYFGYEGNINIAPRECGGCWWMEPNWMSVCVKGMDQPACMTSHHPEEIARLITQAVSKIECNT